MLIRHDLNFNVAGLGNKFLNEDPVVAEAIDRFIDGRLKTFCNFAFVCSNAHAFTAATSRGFNHHWIADFIGNLNRLIAIFDDPKVSRHSVDVGRTRKLFGRNFVAHDLNSFDVRSNEGNASSF